MPPPVRHPLGALVAALLTCSPGSGCGTREEWSGPAGEDRRITVVPFHADSGRRAIQGRAIAESLVARLGAVPGLEARLDPVEAEHGSDFTVRGGVAVRNGRLVIATRLHQPGREEVLWTATFWRRDVVDSSLIADLTTGLAEAIYARLAREAVASRRARP